MDVTQIVFKFMCLIELLFRNVWKKFVRLQVYAMTGRVYARTRSDLEKEIRANEKFAQNRTTKMFQQLKLQ